MPILAFGLRHHQASADELTTFTACAKQAARTLHSLPGVRGMVGLATCNRCEIYLEADQFHPTVRAVRQVLAEAGADPVLLEVADAWSTRNAVQHLFEVTSGLDSMVVGETEIVGQVRAALAAHADFAGGALHRCFQAALSTSKLVTTSTDLPALGRSVASVALDLVEQRHGSLTGREVLLIGTGSYAGVVTADLVRRGARIAVHSATGRAAAFARTHPVTPIDPAGLHARITTAAAVIACSGSGVQQLSAADVVQARAGVFGLLPLVDLALGRDLDPALASTPGVELIDLDAIGRHAPATQTGSLQAAHRLVSQGVEDYLAAERGRQAAPAVTAMRSLVNELIDNELSSVAATSSPEVVEQLSRSLHRVTNALLHSPSARATDSARNGELDSYARALETVFGIEVHP